MEIALYHKHYDKQHLEKVKTEMQKRGAPTIRCIWSPAYNLWMAVEGCHRLRAAHDLGITPIVKDISEQKTVTVQCDEIDTVRRSIAELAEELTDDVWKADILEF